MSSPLIWSLTVKSGETRTRSTEKSWSLGIGVVVLNEKEIRIWKKRKILAEAGLIKG